MISVERAVEAIEGAADLDPGLMADMITRAVAFVQGQTRRYFGPPAATVEYLPGQGTRMLRLAEPVVQVDSDDEVVSVDEQAIGSTSVTVLLPGDYVVRTENAVPPGPEATSKLVRIGGVWLKDYEYAVPYVRGYEVDEGPKDIEDLILELLKHKIQFADKSGMRSESLGGYSYTRFGDSDLDAIDGAKDTIRAWRRAVFA